jgi:hypothetical protein
VPTFFPKGINNKEIIMQPRPKKIDYPFKGWDYQELAIKWNLYAPEFEEPYMDIDIDFKVIQWYLHNIPFNAKRVMRSVAKDIRVFCNKLSESEISHEAPIWKAMSELKDDYSVIRMFYPLVGYAWD